MACEKHGYTNPTFCPMCDLETAMTAEEIVSSAYANFDKWCMEHDPDGELSILDQIDAYDAYMRGLDYGTSVKAGDAE